jgi:hypothetical protein
MLAFRDLWVVFGGLRGGVVIRRVVGCSRLSHARSRKRTSEAHLTPFIHAMRLVTAASKRLALASIFSPNTAQFVAAAGSVSSIPRLAGLPEVKKTDPPPL